MCARRQQEILRAGAKMVCPGGRLVYSTCTFAPEENEETIESFLQEHPEFSPEKVDAPWFTPGPMGSYRVWPHKVLGEGHFVAVLRKAGVQEPELPRIKSEPLPKAFVTFARELGIELPPGRPVTFGSRLFWLHPAAPDLKGLKVERPGLELGEVRKDRLIPAHALALWLRNAAQTVELPADSKELAAYIHGDTIPGKVNGWCLVKAGGYSIGWGKGDGNSIKNHYPKGLRR